MSADEPGAYLVDGHLFFRMPDRSTILCKCIGEPWSRMIVEMWQAQQRTIDRMMEHDSNLIDYLERNSPLDKPPSE